MEEEILELINKLYFSILDDDLEETKKIIPILNQKCKKEESINNYNILNGYNPVIDISFFDISNQSYDYALNNLNNIKIKKQLQWNRKIYILTITKDETEIINLINNFINDDDTLNYYKEQVSFNRMKLDLTKLSFILRNYTLLEKLKQKKQEKQ